MSLGYKSTLCDGTNDWTDLLDWHLLEDELSVNILAYEILSINKPDALDGLDFLWRVCLVAADDVVATKAHDMMLDLTRHMPSTFQPRVRSRLSEELQNALQAMDVDSSNRTLRVQRCLQLIMNLIRGQIRICDNVFSYVQYAKSRSHGFHGYDKKITISLAAREEYKNSIRTAVPWKSAVDRRSMKFFLRHIRSSHRHAWL